ncbi:MAG: hypothetical protein HN919_16435 [Verrucomicrobia bacterium]|nr:hypothetical protein [Verrucomicrobiota bacterium]MBT7699352.1 hypothetical protein [Verrucomicrobiota bacterium]
MLLNQAGELSSRKMERMHTHMAQCTACREWHAALLAIEVNAHEGVASGEPSATVVANIRREARRHADLPAAGARGTPWLRPAYGLAAVAALCVVLVGAHWLRPAPAGGGGEAELSMILVMLTEGTNRVGQVATPSPQDTPASLERLGHDLLVLQGWDEDYSEAELSIPGEALPATAPLTHSTPALPAREYV